VYVSLWFCISLCIPLQTDSVLASHTLFILRGLCNPLDPFNLNSEIVDQLDQWFSAFVRPRPGKFFCYKTRVRYRTAARRLGNTDLDIFFSQFRWRWVCCTQGFHARTWSTKVLYTLKPHVPKFCAPFSNLPCTNRILSQIRSDAVRCQISDPDTQMINIHQAPDFNPGQLSPVTDVCVDANPALGTCSGQGPLSLTPRRLAFISKFIITRLFRKFPFLCRPRRPRPSPN
jgi:hypothetical protein